MQLTVLTVLTGFSGVLHIRMMLCPARPSRLNVISMPNTRRNACARRCQVASQPVPSRSIQNWACRS